MHNSVDPNIKHIVGIVCMVLIIAGRIITATYYAKGGDGGAGNDTGFRVTFVLLIVLFAWIVYFFATGGHFGGTTPLKLE